MKRRNSQAVVLTVVATILLTLTVLLLPGGHFGRVTVVLGYVLLVPGYSVLAALNPNRPPGEGAIGDAKRLSYAFLLSLLIFPATGLSLVAAQVPVTLLSSLILTCVVSNGAAAIAWYRGHRVEASARLMFNLGHLARQHRAQALFVFLVVLILGTTVGIVLTRPDAEDSTQLFLLSHDGRSVAHTAYIAETEVHRFQVVVVSAAHDEKTYRLSQETLYEGERIDAAEWSFSLSPEASWNRTIEFQTRAPGPHQIVFSLNTPETNGMTRSVHLWVMVAE